MIALEALERWRWFIEYPIDSFAKADKVTRQKQTYNDRDFIAEDEGYSYLLDFVLRVVVDCRRTIRCVERCV